MASLETPTGPAPPNPPHPVEKPSNPPPLMPTTKLSTQSKSIPTRPASRKPRLAPLTPSTLPAYLETLDTLYEHCIHDFRKHWKSNAFEPTTDDAMKYWLEESLARFNVLNTTVLLLTNGDALYQAHQWADVEDWGVQTSGRLGMRRMVYSPVWVVAAAAIDELQDKVAELERWLRGTATGNWWHVGKYATASQVRPDISLVLGGVRMLREMRRAGI